VHPALALALAYASGSLPFAWLAGKAGGVDLRTQGSGNLGATNVFRVLGWKIGIAVFLADALKGADTAARTVMVPAVTAVDLIGRQLSDRERDAAFRESMRVAHAMAERILAP